MGSVFPLSLLLLSAAAYWGSGTVPGRRARRAQGPRESPPAPSGTSASFWVRISPQSVAVRPGVSVWLNCSHSCPLPPNSSLHTQLRRGPTLSGPGWVSYQLLDVRAWSSDVRCFVTCAGETRGATARIATYRWHVHSALSRDARPGALHWPGSGQRDADPRVPRGTPRLRAARDLPRVPQSRRAGGRQQLGTHYADARLEPRVRSLGLHFRRSPCGHPCRRGGCLPAQVPSDAVSA
uniref:Intercellular adhesion molecule 4 (Landsteiner-Wiener blood group) n=1 Tax=Microcebus murinus TaxID=30608 RepID=A0A8C5UZ38_MICMU